MKSPRVIFLTGATGAIGGALARLYAQPRVTLILHGRNQAQLQSLADECRKSGAAVATYQCDLRDYYALDLCINNIQQEFVIDLAILSHGVNINHGPLNKGETWAEAEALFDINVRATMAIVHSLVPHMRARRAGQIALMSSLAAYYGLPVTPSYSASKAALKTYGEAMRAWLAPEGVEVNVIMPGYVKSDMCDAMPGPKPFLLTPDRAAKKIQQGLHVNQPRISFPFPLNFGCWLLSISHPSVAQRILGWLSYHA
jgi:short-subunit dehydrogenase